MKFLNLKVIIFVVGWLFFLSVSAQVISVNAGVVKKLDGEVFYRCHNNEKELLKLLDSSALHNEDTLLTKETGNTILSLNPDSYMFVDADALIKVKNNELDKMHFDMERGKIVLFIRSLKNGASLVIHTPPGIPTIYKGGLYRINVGKEGNTEANVFKGELRYFDERGELIKLKKSIQVNFVKKRKIIEK